LNSLFSHQIPCRTTKEVSVGSRDLIPSAFHESTSSGYRCLDNVFQTQAWTLKAIGESQVRKAAGGPVRPTHSGNKDNINYILESPMR
jgi:hypothetical protein